MLIDNTPPELRFDLPAADLATNDPEFPIRLSYTDAISTAMPATLDVLLDGASQRAAFDIGPAQADRIAGALVLADGTHELTATIADAAGNIGSARRIVVLDRQPPSAPTIDPPISPTGIATITLAGDRSADSFDIQVNGSSEGVSLATPERWQKTVTLQEGSNSFSVRALDAVGNASAAVSATVVLDQTAPRLVISPAPGSTLTSRVQTVTLAWSDPSGVDPGSLRVIFNGEDFSAKFTRDTNGATYAFTGPTAFQDGANSLQVDLADALGNTTSTIANYQVASAQ
ncbi:MAG: hypothetical protein HY718_15655, partial [Planctomycetes bacterium]|nr:hypothetical protein [Planctomycetota bacterium]